MEREHLIIVAILALVLYMLMKHSGDCNCTGCMQDKMLNMPARIRYGVIGDDVPTSARIRYRGIGDDVPTSGYIRHSDKYIGAGQHIKNHIRYDSKHGMFNGMFSGAPSHHIRYGCGPDGNSPCDSM
jgi:hypothetical protein